MLFMKKITFSSSTLRDPSIDIDDVLDYDFRKVLKKLQCWTFKVTKFHHCDNLVLLLLS